MIDWNWIARKLGGATILVCIWLLMTVLIQVGYYVTYWQALLDFTILMCIGVVLCLVLSTGLTWLLD